jgi:DNA-binding IclR family transcriptional regulator
MSTKGTNSRKTIASVQRALDIINLFNADHGELGNAEIARMMGLPVGTASGLIYTLKVNNCLHQNSQNRKYSLGLKLAERTSILLEQLDLRKIAAPYMEELKTWCGESVNLAVRDGYAVVYIERMFGSQPLGIRSELGKRAPLHSTALGKAILTFLPETERSTLLENYEFRKVTPSTIDNMNDFLKELERVRHLGYAVDEQENEVGGRCVGAPIFDFNGYPIGAVSISIPIIRFPNNQIGTYGERLKSTANAISNQMGYGKIQHAS